MFGKKQWVSFPFTSAQVSAHRVSAQTVTGAR